MPVPVITPPSQDEINSVNTEIAVRKAAGGGAVSVGSTMLTSGFMLPQPAGAVVSAIGGAVMLTGMVVGTSAANADPAAMLVRRQLRASGYSARYARAYAKMLELTPTQLAEVVTEQGSKNSGAARDKEEAARAVLVGDAQQQAYLAIARIQNSKVAINEREVSRVRLYATYLFIALTICTVALLIGANKRLSAS